MIPKPKIHSDTKQKYLTEYKYYTVVDYWPIPKLEEMVSLVELTVINQTDKHVKIEFEDGKKCWLTKDKFESDYKIIRILDPTTVIEVKPKVVVDQSKVIYKAPIMIYEHKSKP